jgi:hypothetical protein
VAAQEVAAVAAGKAAVVGAVKVKVKARMKVAVAVEARVAAVGLVPESARLREEVRVQPSYLGKAVENRS